MKKLLLSFLTMVVAAVCGVSASAQDWSTTVKWSDPGTIVIKKGTSYTSATDVAIPEGATSVTLTEADGYFVVPADGYAIVSGDLDGTTKPVVIVDYKTGLKGISIRAQYNVDKTAYNGKTLVVNVVKLEYKPFSLEVANGASGLTFTFYNDGNEVSALSGVVDGKNSLEFPSTANQLYIQSGSWPRNPLHSVKLGGVEQELTNTLQNYYLVPLTEGCEIYVAKEDPATAKNCEVTFKFTNNNPNIVATIRDWTASKFIYPEEFGAADYKLIVPNNGDIQFNWNQEATITSLTQNGTTVAIKEGNNRVTITDDTEFVITGTMTAYEQKTVQLYLTDAENVSFTANGEDFVPTYVKDVPAGFELESGYTIPVATKLYEGTVEAKEYAGVSFDVNEGYYVKQAVRGTLAGDYSAKDDIYIDGTTKINLENMPLYLDVAKIDYSATAWVYYEGPDGASAMLGCNNPYQGARTLAQGWNQIMLDPGYNTAFTVRVNTTDETQDWVKTVELDGTALSADENEIYNMPGKLVNNSVLKVFFASAAVAPYVTTFETSATKDAEISYDKCKTVDLATTTEVTNYGSTPYVIKPGTGVVVKIDGVEQTPNADGVVEYTATKAATITLDVAKVESAEPGTLDPVSGSTVRSISTIRYELPITDEYMPNYDWKKTSEITITSTAAGAEPISAESVEQVGGGETSIILGITFPTITEAGEYTLNIPAGVFTQTTFTGDYIRDFAACTATYTVDPSIPYNMSFDPANGSQNELPTDGLLLKVTVDGNSIEPAEDSAVGPWVKYNGVDIPKVDDSYAVNEEGIAAWSWGQSWDMASGKMIPALDINQSVFKVAGTLEITADEGAFLIDGENPSPAFTYSANFGEKKEYTATFDPASGSTVPAVKPVISFTLEGATSIAVNPDGFDAYFRMGMQAGVQISETQITIEGNKLTYTAENEEAFSPGTYTFVITEGSLIIDDSQLNEEISAKYVVERTTAPSQEWSVTPTGACVNEGYGMYVAFIFGEEETVARGEKFSDIKVEFDGVALAPYDSSTPDVEGYQIAMESSMPNALMINVMGGKFNNASTEGELTVTLPVGSVNISGTYLAKEAVYTWVLVPAKTYTISADPASGSTVKELTKINISFPEAKTVALSESFRLGKVSVYQGYSWIGDALSVTSVEGAEVPTLEITIAPITEAGEYEIRISYDAFTIDSYYTNGNETFKYTVKPDLTGIEGIAAEDGLYTVVSLQGVVLMKDVEAAALDTLPTGLYIINGQKIYLRK